MLIAPVWSKSVIEQSPAGNNEDVLLLTCWLLLQCESYFSVELHQRAAQFIRDTYETQRATRTREELTECLGPEEVERLEAQVFEREKVVKMFELMRTGRVLDSTPTSIPANNTDPLPAVSGAGRCAYPHEALKPGVAWPCDVDPEEREAWLSTVQFTDLFKMTWQQYQALPKWKQQRLKAEHALF
jgi:hypothetical protein